MVPRNLHSDTMKILVKFGRRVGIETEPRNRRVGVAELFNHVLDVDGKAARIGVTRHIARRASDRRVADRKC